MVKHKHFYRLKYRLWLKMDASLHEYIFVCDGCSDYYLIPKPKFWR